MSIRFVTGSIGLGILLIGFYVLIGLRADVHWENGMVGEWQNQQQPEQPHLSIQSK